LLAGGAVFISERRKAEGPVSPRAVLTMAADVQRGASRVPAVVTRISDAEEIQIGDSMAARATMRFGSAAQDPDDVVVEAYIQKFGSHLAARAQRKLPYRFHYIPDEWFENAFALPGGHVFIGKGLLAEMDSEDQLAAVLGHEIEHIDRRHCVERVQLEAQMRKLPLGGVGALAEIPVEIFQAGYTKNQELEADSKGTRLAVRAGYSYQGAVRFFEAMDKHSERTAARAQKKSLRREIGKLAVQTVTGYFESHPPKAERIRQIRELAVRERWQARSEKPLPEAVAQQMKVKPNKAAAQVGTTP
jgi:predicted Zn-dependent protease